MTNRWILRVSILYLVVFLLSISLIFIFAPDAHLMTHVHDALVSPNLHYIFGTDSLGRDLLFRTMNGAFLSLVLGLGCGVLAMIIGICYGGVSAWFGGWVDQIMMRIMELLIATPQMITMGLFILYFSKKIQSELYGLIISISFSTWMVFARLTRNMSLREKNLPYVESEIAIGAHPVRVFFRAIVPNILPSILVLAGLQLPNFLLFESFLSFIGIGVQSPQASWGVLLREGWRSMSVYPHLLIFPSVILFLTVFSLNVLFDHFRFRLQRRMEAVDLHH